MIFYGNIFYDIELPKMSPYNVTESPASGQWRTDGRVTAEDATRSEEAVLRREFVPVPRPWARELSYVDV